MASMQKSREERARSAAQKAADEVAASRRNQQVHDHEATAPVSPRGGGGGGGGGGILSSVQESARSVMGAVRGTFSVGGRRDDDDGGSGTAAARGGTAADKATAAMERAKEYAVETKEGARRAVAGDAVARKGETDESAWQQGQDVRRRAAEKAREEARRAHGPSEEEKGRAATENIYGKAKGATGAFREKMVMPTDVVERKRAEAAARGGEKGEAATAASPAPGIGDDGHGRREPAEEDDVMLRVKAADQMTGQAFNDVGKMGEEGTGMPPRRR